MRTINDPAVKRFDTEISALREKQTRLEQARSVYLSLEPSVQRGRSTARKASGTDTKTAKGPTLPRGRIPASTDDFNLYVEKVANLNKMDKASALKFVTDKQKAKQAKKTQATVNA